MSKGKKNGNIHPTRIFKTAQELYEAFEEYKDSLSKQAEEWLKVQYVGKEGERKTDKYKLPKTYEGFKKYCYLEYGCVEQYFKNQGGLYEDFVQVCSRIKNEIREDQIIGGMLGIYNPSITQRLNGLTDKKELEHKGIKLGRAYDSEYED